MKVEYDLWFDLLTPFLLPAVAAGNHGPRGWTTLYPECAAMNQSPVDVTDKQAVVSEEYQELQLDNFNTESSNRTTMKNTGKTGGHTLFTDNIASSVSEGSHLRAAGWSASIITSPTQTAEPRYTNTMVISGRKTEAPPPQEPLGASNHRTRL